jgi:hypothetical protein
MWVIVAFTITAQLYVISHVYDTKSDCQSVLKVGIMHDMAKPKPVVRSAQCVEVVPQAEER